MLALDGDVKVGRAETRDCSSWGGVGPPGESPSKLLGLSLQATEKEFCSNAGSWGRAEGTGWDQKEVQQEWTAGRAKQARPAGMPQGGLWYPGEGMFFGTLRKGPRRHSAFLSVLLLKRRMKGKGEEPREMNRDGSSWDWPLALNESSHLGR